MFHRRLLSRQCLLVLVALVLLAGAAPALAREHASPSARPPDLSLAGGCQVLVYGQVVDDDGRPVRSALVRAYAYDPSEGGGAGPLDTTSTNRQGTFVFSRLPGNVQFWLLIQAYFSPWSWPGAPLRFTPGPEVVLGPFGPFPCGDYAALGALVYSTSPPGITVDGYAHMGADCVPKPTDPRLYNREVELWSLDDTHQMVDSTRTNSQGYFEFTVTRSGDYDLKILNWPGDVSHPNPITVDGDTRWNYFTDGAADVPDGTWCQP